LKFEVGRTKTNCTNKHTQQTKEKRHDQQPTATDI